MAKKGMAYSVVWRFRQTPLLIHQRTVDVINLYRKTHASVQFDTVPFALPSGKEVTVFRIRLTRSIKRPISSFVLGVVCGIILPVLGFLLVWLFLPAPPSETLALAIGEVGDGSTELFMSGFGDPAFVRALETALAPERISSPNVDAHPPPGVTASR